ncbi:MAG: cytidine deaminase [Rubellimicrobium sp.]|nr:cytidine deaminase [Rubellimicrobium sp.]
MSLNPFPADPAVPLRLAGQNGEGLRARALAALAPGLVLPEAEVARIVAEEGLAGPEDLMLHLVAAARVHARPPVSGYFVGAVGMLASGDVILGGNLEYPGTHLGMTVHGEGFVATRAMQLGQRLNAIALDEAHPCAHCRQFLSEFAGGPDLWLIDPLGHRLRLSDLYPWPFDPGYLGQAGAVPGAETFPGLASDGPELLDQTGRRAWAPYSRCPGAVVLDLRGGGSVAGASFESVAFNPTLPPLQAALIALLAGGGDYADITGAHLGTVIAGAVDYSATTRATLATIAPDAPLTIHGWTP